VERLGKLCQVSAGAKPAVDVEIVGSVVTMAFGLEYRPQVEGVGAKALDVIQPAQDLAQAGLGLGMKIVEVRARASPSG
jgi:hypothetical protein